MGKGARQRRERQQEQEAFHLTPSQEKAMRKEINAQILEAEKRYWLDMDAAVLWALHKEFGYGEKRLKRFFDRFAAVHEELKNYYQLDDTDAWLYRHLLKTDVGVDVEAWEKEFEEHETQNYSR